MSKYEPLTTTILENYNVKNMKKSFYSTYKYDLIMKFFDNIFFFLKT